MFMGSIHLCPDNVLSCDVVDHRHRQRHKWWLGMCFGDKKGFHIICINIRLPYAVLRPQLLAYHVISDMMTSWTLKVILHPHSSSSWRHPMFLSSPPPWELPWRCHGCSWHCYSLKLPSSVTTQWPGLAHPPSTWNSSWTPRRVDGLRQVHQD